MIGLICIAVAAAGLVAFYVANRESVTVDGDSRRQAPGSFVRLTHGVTHYQAAGPERGQVLVFMTGATLSLRIWDGIFEKLAASGYRVVRYDYFGRGYSDRPRIDYTMDVFHHQLKELLEHLGVSQPVTLVPLAFGCPIAAAVAIKSPNLVSSLCLLAPDGFGVPLSPMMKLCLKPIIGPPLFQMFGSKALESRLTEYSADSSIIKRLRKSYVPELKFRGFKASLVSSLRCVPIDDARNLYRDLNTQSTVPQLVIWGTADQVTAIPSQEYVRELFPRAEIHFLEGVGHLPHWERLDETHAIIDQFLKSQSSSGAGNTAIARSTLRANS